MLPLLVYAFQIVPYNATINIIFIKSIKFYCSQAHAKKFTEIMDKLIANLETKEIVIEELRAAGRSHAVLPRDPYEQCMYFSYSYCIITHGHISLFCFRLVNQILTN